MVKLDKIITSIFIIALILFSETIVLIKDNMTFNVDEKNIKIKVITKNEKTKENEYYAIDKNNKLFKVKKFDSNVSEKYYLYNCYSSYIENNTILNKLTLDSCIITDYRKEYIKSNDKGNVIMDDKLKKIIVSVSKLKHDITQTKIFKIHNDYYVTLLFNVNLHSPYHLYYYNSKADNLESIYTFENEEIVDLYVPIDSLKDI